MSLTEKQVALGLGTLAVAFNFELSRETILAYHQGLRDMPPEAFQLAVQNALRAGRYFPRVSELREQGGAVSPEDRAVKAWGKVSAAVSAVGGYRSVCFSDPVTNATIRALGGWMSVCDPKRTVREFDTFLRKSFLETYQAIMRTGFTEAEGGHLLGIHEAAWQSGGLHRMIEENPPEMIECHLPPVPDSVPRIGGKQEPAPQLGVDLKQIGHIPNEETDDEEGRDRKGCEG